MNSKRLFMLVFTLAFISQALPFAMVSSSYKEQMEQASRKLIKKLEMQRFGKVDYHGRRDEFISNVYNVIKDHPDHIPAYLRFFIVHCLPNGYRPKVLIECFNEMFSHALEQWDTDVLKRFTKKRYSENISDYILPFTLPIQKTLCKAMLKNDADVVKTILQAAEKNIVQASEIRTIITSKAFYKTVKKGNIETIKTIIDFVTSDANKNNPFISKILYDKDGNPTCSVCKALEQTMKSYCTKESKQHEKILGQLLKLNFTSSQIKEIKDIVDHNLEINHYSNETDDIFFSSHEQKTKNRSKQLSHYLNKILEAEEYDEDSAQYIHSLAKSPYTSVPSRKIKPHLKKLPEYKVSSSLYAAADKENYDFIATITSLKKPSLFTCKPKATYGIYKAFKEIIFKLSEHEELRKFLVKKFLDTYVLSHYQIKKIEQSKHIKNEKQRNKILQEIKDNNCCNGVLQKITKILSSCLNSD